MTAPRKLSVLPMSTRLLQIPQHELRAERCRRSFYFFVREFWSSIISEDPVWNWHIKLLCDEMQALGFRVIERQPKLHDLIINIPPGSTKSTICSIMFVPWIWTVDPTIRVINGSYSSPLSLDHSTKARDIIRSDLYRKYFPEIVLKDDEDTKSNFKNTLHGQRFSTSVGGAVTGMHGHIIIIDDPLNPKEAVSDIKLAGAADWMDSTLSQRKVNKENTPLVLIMQRLHTDDPTGHQLAKNKGTTKHICLPADRPEGALPAELADNYVDGFLDPVRISRKVCEEARIDLGAYGYSGQYDQNPIPREGKLFKTECSRIIDALPLGVVRSVRYWDKAGSEGRGCYTAGVRMHLLKDGRVCVSDVKREQLSYDAREKLIKQTAELDSKQVSIWLEQEGGSGGKESAQRTVRMLSGFDVHAESVTGDKSTRALPYSAQMEAGNVLLLRALWNKAYLDELSAFPVGKYKDQVDASSGAFNKLFETVQPRKVGVW